MMLVPPPGSYLIAQGLAPSPRSRIGSWSAAHPLWTRRRSEFVPDAVPTSRGILSADTSTSGEVVDWNAPEQWVPHLKKMIADTYGVGEVK